MDYQTVTRKDKLLTEPEQNYMYLKLMNSVHCNSIAIKLFVWLVKNILVFQKSRPIILLCWLINLWYAYIYKVMLPTFIALQCYFLPNPLEIIFSTGDWGKVDHFSTNIGKCTPYSFIIFMYQKVHTKKLATKFSRNE